MIGGERNSRIQSLPTLTMTSTRLSELRLELIHPGNVAAMFVLSASGADRDFVVTLTILNALSGLLRTRDSC